MSPPRPLAGLQVLELASGPAAAFCGRQFANWGAEVTPLEPPEGSALRRMGPRWRLDGREGSVPFEFLTTGKRPSALSPEHAAERLGTADILICDGSPSAVSAVLGVRFDELRARFPRLVLVSVTPFGLAAADAGDDACALTLQALTGYLSLNGPADGPPITAPARLIEHAIGASAFVGALAALIRRLRTGDGELVGVRGLETVAGLLPYLRDQHRGEAMTREGGTLEGARLLPCADGYVAVAPAIPAHLPIYREVLGVPEAEAPAAFLDGERRDALARIVEALSPYAARLPVEAVFQGLQARGVVCGKVRSPAAVLADPQLRARGFFQPVDHPAAGPLPVAGSAARWRAADPQAAEPESVRPPSDPPLAGITVLDLTQAWIGPLAGMILADLGARVIKVESPSRPDIWRLLGQAEPGQGAPTAPVNRSWYFNAVNRGKQGLGLDLARPEGAAAFLDLAARADVVLENFTPRVMARFGLAYPALAARNRRLVMTSFSGFGADGPHADFKANGVSIEALAGWDALHRDAAGAPVLMGAYPADPICGLQMAAGTLVGLYRRFAAGAGGHMEGSMLEAAAEYVGDALLAEALAQAGAEVVEQPLASRVVADGPDWAVRARNGKLIPMRSTLDALDEPRLADWFVPLAAPGLGVSRHNGPFWRFERARQPGFQPPPRVGEHTREVLAAFGFADDRSDALIAEGVAGSVA